MGKKQLTDCSGISIRQLSIIFSIFQPKDQFKMREGSDFLFLLSAEIGYRG
mgnify:CR=1 FL=1